jgi:hypothetical protein
MVLLVRAPYFATYRLVICSQSLVRGSTAGWRLRGRVLLVQARGDDPAYREYLARYRAKAQACGYQGHLAMAEAMA